MARKEKAIFTNLCMISDGRGNVLVEDRKDPSWPGICFPGGHVEPGESFVEAVIREVWEETGLTIRNPKLIGSKSWMQKDGSRYLVLLYIATEYEGEIPGAAPKDCGNYLLQDLPMAKWEANKYLHEVLENITEENLVYPQ